MFVRCEICSTKHNDTNGKEVESCSWKHLQATTSISKYPLTARSLVLVFCQLWSHLHMGLTVLLSLDLHVYFFAQNWPRYWKRKMRWLFEIPAGHQKDCSSLWYQPSLLGAHRKEGSIAFLLLLYMGALLLLVCLSAYTALIPHVFWKTCQQCCLHSCGEGTEYFMPSLGKELHWARAAFLVKHQFEREGLYMLLWSPVFLV